MKLPFISESLLPAFIATTTLAFTARSSKRHAPGIVLPKTTDPRAQQVVDLIREEVPELLLVAVVDTTTGRDLASFTTIPTFEPHVAARFNAEVVKLKTQALEAFRMHDELLEDMIISTTSQHHLIKTVNNLERFIYLAVSTRTTKPGMAREILRRAARMLVS